VTRAEQYRAQAVEADGQAQRTSDREARATLERVAAQWRKMAEQVERHPLDTETNTMWRHAAAGGL
jgi:hypothetical protein